MSLQAIEPKESHSLAMPEEEMGTGKQTFHHLITNTSSPLYSRQMLSNFVCYFIFNGKLLAVIYITLFRFFILH